MKYKIIAMIPARAGSKRLANKNLALLNGKPLIYYAIKAAKDSNIFDKIVINSDSEIYSKISKRYNVDFYKRPKFLGGSNIKSDDVVLDFIKKNSCETIVWVNSIAPMQTSSEIIKCVNYFIKKKLNSLITTVEKKAHFLIQNKPINFNSRNKFAKTQDLVPLQEMVYSLMMWRSNTFMSCMKKNNSAILHGKVAYYSVGKLSSFIVKNKSDLMIVESILSSKELRKNILKYDKILC